MEVVHQSLQSIDTQIKEVLGHFPKIALVFGLTQEGISRDLRRLLLLIRHVLPCPDVWNVIEKGQAAEAPDPLESDQLRHGRALADATEQRGLVPVTTRRASCTTQEKSLHPENAKNDRWQSSHRGDQQACSRGYAR